MIFPMLLHGAVKLKLSPGVVSNDRVLSFNGKSGFAEIKDSQKYHPADKGLTISATIRLRKRPKITGSGFDANKQIVYSHDIIAAKGREFVFGRRSDLWVDQMYFNFSDGKEWVVPLTRGVKTPPYGTWAVWTVTLEPINVREEGRTGGIIAFYLNGDLAQRVEVDSLPEKLSDPVQLGRGLGIKGDKCFFNGELAEFAIYDRPFNEDEVLELAQKSKLVKISPSGFKPVTKTLASKLKKLSAASPAPLNQWTVSALRRAAQNGYNNSKLNMLLDKITHNPLGEKPAAFVKNWNRLDSGFKAIKTDNMLALIAEHSGKGIFPILAVFDLHGNCGLFGRKSIFWELTLRKKNNEKQLLSSGTARWQISKLKKNGRNYEAVITWKLPDGLSAVSHLRILDRRIELDLKVNNPTTNILLEEIMFPAFRLAKKQQGRDILVHPSQSGVLYYNPTVGTTPRPYYYPTGWLNMQFGAYYDTAGGVYFSPEDPVGNVKQYSVRGRNGDLEVCWSHSVPFSPGQKGGNSFSIDGSAALELFKGDWFDAGQCYKRFVSAKAKWWIPDLPRKSTPKWFRDNTLWISHWTFNANDMRKMPVYLKRLRDYLGLPFGVHWYRWYDKAKGGMPHFIPKKQVLELIKKIQSYDIKVKPYIDNRLWSELDGPGCKTDWMFSSHGRKFAVKNRDGSLNYERYRKECRDVVMCPACPQWQQMMCDITERMAAYGFDMVYHDQVAASRPFVCSDPNHGHSLNSNRAWVKGYRKMFALISRLRSKFPRLCHDTEDAADAYLSIFDGFMPWRWTDNNQVPLFASVYSGRVQFTGREFDHTTKGDSGSFFVKTASQMVNAEQIGWFTLNQLLQDSRRPLYIKQMAHLRKALLEYFNEGEMLKPLKFKAPLPEQTMLWGVAASKPRKVTMPKILHSVWKHPNAGTMILFVNSVDEEVKIEPKLDLQPGRKLFICRMNSAKPECRTDVPELKLSPYQFAVWLLDNSGKAQELAAELHEFSQFTADNFLTAFGILDVTGPKAPHLNFDDEISTKAFKGAGCFSLKGNGRSTLQHKFKLMLEPDTTYVVNVAVRKDSAKGYLAVANYDRQRKLKMYSVFGNVPDDGKWHKVKNMFKTDSRLHSCGLYLYNKKSNGTIQIDELSIRKSNN